MSWKVFVFAVKVFPTVLSTPVGSLSSTEAFNLLDFVQRYAILAADEAKSNSDTKVCVDAMLNRLVKQKDLDGDNFRVGLTKVITMSSLYNCCFWVFFKAGVVAHIEDLRDKRLATLIGAFQAVCRWYYATVMLPL